MPSAPSLALLVSVVVASCGGSAPVAPTEPSGRVSGGVPVFEGTFEPVDETASDPGFAAFVERLGAAVAARDTAALVAATSPTARFSFDDVPLGADGLRAVWLDGREAELWDALERVLGGGFVAEEDAFTAPYVFALWPSDADPFAHVAVPGRGVAAYDQPGGDVVARLSTVVLPALTPRQGDWWAVRLPSGAAAFVEARHVVSPLGHRLTAWPDAGGAWRIQTMLSGD